MEEDDVFEKNDLKNGSNIQKGVSGRRKNRKHISSFERKEMRKTKQMKDNITRIKVVKIFTSILKVKVKIKRELKRKKGKE